jgi:hypothetical protein
MNRALDRRHTRRAHRTAGPAAPFVSILQGSNSENVLLVGASKVSTRATPAVMLSLVNTSPSQAVKLSVKLAGRTPTSWTGTILTAPDVQPSRFFGAVLTGKVVQVTLPARSLVVLTVHQRARPAARPESTKRPQAM